MPRRLLSVVWVFAACASTARGQMATPATPAANAGDGGPTSQADAGGAGVAPAPAELGRGGADLGTEADFAAARARFDRGDREGARAALEAFVAQHPDHPDRPTAEILLARLALARGDAAQAKTLLAAHATGGGPADAAGTAARYYLGLAELRLGDPARARALLLPFLPRGAGEPSPTDDAAIELRGALAEATGAADPAAALELWDGYLRVARESEKAFARRRATELGGQMSPEAAWRAYGAAPPASLARAVLGAKAALYLRGRADATGAGFVETESNAARHALGFDVAVVGVGPGDPTRVGLAIPLSGKFQVVGEAALRAAMLAGGMPGASAAGAAGLSQLVVRDTATDGARAARGIAELTRGEAVIAIVGAANAKAGAAAIAQATDDGIAVLALEDAAPGAMTTAFQMIHAPETRATALALQALKLGARRFAIIGPDNASGKRLSEAFRKAVLEGGGTIVVESTYVAGATSFAAAVAPLRTRAVDAVFVPDSAERLPLIAPALAVADLWPQPWGKSRAGTAGGPSNAAANGTSKAGGGKAAASSGRPRAILLLSTANELSRKLVDSAGRYVQGALLCPGFFPDAGDARAHAFVDGYRAAYGQDPHATEAYAYDAVATLQAVVRQGARTRGDVVRALSTPGTAVFHGLTGGVTFGPNHGRADSPQIYVVDGDDIHLAR